MIQNACEKFTEDVVTFLTNKSFNTKGLLVKKHNEHFQTHGDFSFPVSAKSWQGLVDFEKGSVDSDKTILELASRDPTDLILGSINWLLRVGKVKEEKGRLYMFLERPMAMRLGLQESQINNVLLLQRLNAGSNVVDFDSNAVDCDITTWRTKCFHKVVCNLCAVFSVDKPLLVTCRSSAIGSNRQLLLSGTVLNVKTGAKETSISSDDFIRLRQNEMTLIAQHKYGVRVSTDSKWKEFIAHLGESAVVFELLQTRPSSAVKINFDCSSVGSSKGASFILYNCARLETIIRTYNERVEEGTYPPFPDFDATDFTLLTQEDEWTLIFNYILGLPLLLANCVELNERSCEFRPHHLCSFLCSMVRVFSQYYRRVRILTEPRKHLLPVMFARIHMLKVLNDNLKTCLKILNIKSVSQM